MLYAWFYEYLALQFSPYETLVLLLNVAKRNWMYKFLLYTYFMCGKVTVVVCTVFTQCLSQI